MEVATISLAIPMVQMQKKEEKGKWRNILKMALLSLFSLKRKRKKKEALGLREEEGCYENEKQRET